MWFQHYGFPYYGDPLTWDHFLLRETRVPRPVISEMTTTNYLYEGSHP